MTNPPRRYAWSPRDYLLMNQHQFGIKKTVSWKTFDILPEPQSRHRLQVAQWQHRIFVELREAYKDEGFLYKDLARYLQISPEHLSHLMHGKGAITLEQQAGIKQFLIDQDWFEDSDDFYDRMKSSGSNPKNSQ